MALELAPGLTPVEDRWDLWYQAIEDLARRHPLKEISGTKSPPPPAGDSALVATLTRLLGL
jgi:hypothetical protein